MIICDLSNTNVVLPFTLQIKSIFLNKIYKTITCYTKYFFSLCFCLITSNDLKHKYRIVYIY